LLRANALIDYALVIDASRSESAARERRDAFNEAERNLISAGDKSNQKLAGVHLQMARVYRERGETVRAADALDQYLLMEPNAKNAEEIRTIIRKLRTPPGQIEPSATPP